MTNTSDEEDLSGACLPKGPDVGVKNKCRLDLASFTRSSKIVLDLYPADSISLFVKISSSLISEFSKIGCRIGISFLNNMEHILAHSSKRMISLLNQMVIRFLYEIIL